MASVAFRLARRKTADASISVVLSLTLIDAKAYFQCPVEFGADRNVLLLSHEAMTQPFVSANPDLLDLLEPQFEAALHERDSQLSFIEQVKRLIRGRIAGQPPTVQEVAREL